MIILNVLAVILLVALVGRPLLGGPASAAVDDPAQLTAADPQALAKLQNQVQSLQRFIADSHKARAEAEAKAVAEFARLNTAQSDAVKQLNLLPGEMARIHEHAESNHKSLLAVDGHIKELAEASETAWKDAADTQGQHFDGVGRQFGEVRTALKALDELKELAGRVAATEAAITRLRDSLAVPSDDRLPRVLFVLDGGRQMLDYAHEDVRRGLVTAVERAGRMTPSRELGLVLATGGRAVEGLSWGKPYPDKLAQFRERAEQLQPDRGENTDWESACRRGLEQLATKSKDVPRRLVYVACNPSEPPGFDPTRLAEMASNQGIEIWVVQLSRGPNDRPGAELATLATGTGGQLIVLRSGRDGGAPGPRFAAALDAALALPTTPEGR